MPSLSAEQITLIGGRSTLLSARCVIRIDGTVSNCAMVCSNSSLDRAILDNLALRRYTPVIFQGRPVDVPYTFMFRIVGPEDMWVPGASRTEADGNGKKEH